MTKSVLIIGASGRLGQSLIRAFSTHVPSPAIHAFLRTPSKLPPTERALCATLQPGDALLATDLLNALQRTKPDTIVISIGVPDSTAPSTLRGGSAKALAQALGEGGFSDARVVCISSIGAGGSAVKLGFGIGALVRWRLRYLLADHDVQEGVLRALGGSRVLVVRPTGLVDGKRKGSVVAFEDEERCPSVSIGRDQVAEFVVGKVCAGAEAEFGGCVNVASVGGDNGVWGIRALFTLV